MTSMPYLKQAPNGVYYVHWTQQRIGKRISTRTADPDAAKVFFARWMLNEHRTPVTGGVVTVADCWAVYDREHVQKKVVERKKAAYCWSLLAPSFGALTAASLSQRDIDAYVAQRTKTVAPATVRNELGYLLAALNFCTSNPHKLLEKAVVADVLDGLVLPAHGAPRDRWLRDAEVKALLEAAADLRDGAVLSRGERFLWLALHTAARKAAIMDLTWDRVHFDTGTIDFDVPGRQITKKRRATVPISTALRPVLERAYRERTGDLVMGSRSEIWWTVQTIAVRAGLGLAPEPGERQSATGISPHVLRHTAATHMARNGVALWIIARVLGNTLGVCERVYAKWQPAEMRAAVDMISAVQPRQPAPAE